MKAEELIAAARGDKAPTLLLRNARIVNVFTLEVEEGSVAIFGERIAGVGDYERGEEEIDLEGKFVVPAFFDAHVHIESSYLHPAEFIRILVPRGVLGAATDAHEIANVAGASGIEFFRKSASGLPFDLVLLAPSCVPATHLETSGYKLGPEELRELLERGAVWGLGEMMNFPGAIGGDPEVLRKLEYFEGRVREGHAPGVSGRGLCAYLCAGLLSDHECTSFEEGREKLARGMYLMMREGSSAKNLKALLPLLAPETSERCILVTDDRSPLDLLEEGGVDAVVRKAIKLGLNPLLAIKCASFVPRRFLGMERRGAIAPGYFADFFISSDLRELPVEEVFFHGRLVARDGKPLFSPSREVPPELLGTVNCDLPSPDDLKIPACGETFPVIEVIPNEITTRRRDERVRIREGFVEPDPEGDLLKLVVVERHHRTGNVGKGLVRGFGLRRGALASSVAHDSHNLIAVGAGDEDIIAALEEIKRMGGGLVIAAGGRVLESLPLPIAGLLSQAPAEEVARKLRSLERRASELGCSLPSPFSTLSFLALPVIPELRLTDKGLVDVREFRIIL